jgi:hypothetical protein
MELTKRLESMEIAQQKRLESMEIAQQKRSESMEIAQQKRLESMEIAQQSIRMDTRQLISRLPDATIAIDLTPTNASASTKDSLYIQALQLLDIVIPVPSLDIYECNPEENSFQFVWNWRSKHEKDSYEPLNQKLIQADYHSVVIDNGQNLLNKYLFNEQFWALRKQEHERVLFIGTVHGRADLVILSSPLIPNGFITRNMVRFCLEIKMHSEISTPSGLTSCIREAVTQLLGLTVGNINNCPSVILTDLTQTFFCIYLVMEQNMPAKFSIKVQKCADLASALHLAEVKGDHLQANGRPICFNFARRPTPASSEVNNMDNHDSASDDLEGIA